MKNKKVLIIAEAGVNHNGNLNIAKKMVTVAKNCGADYIKFQSFTAKKLATKSVNQAPYQKANTKKQQSQYNMLKKLELSERSHLKILQHCKKRKIGFLSTGFDIENIKFLVKKCKMNTIKIPSGEITNIPYLKFIGKLKKQILLSTGMSNLNEIKMAIRTLTTAGTNKKNITVLHCTSAYPAPIKELNLKAMIYIKKKLKINIGYSDHSTQLETSVAATTLGAKVIEKHFTLNKKYSGPDHKASLEPKELKLMIAMIRNVERSLGKEKKYVTKSEKKNLIYARKSIVASKKIKKGEVFTEKNICCKRPAKGISPVKWNQVIGKKALRNYRTDDLIKI